MTQSVHGDSHTTTMYVPPPRLPHTRTLVVLQKFADDCTPFFMYRTTKKENLVTGLHLFSNTL